MKHGEIVTIHSRHYVGQPKLKRRTLIQAPSPFFEQMLKQRSGKSTDNNLSMKLLFWMKNNLPTDLDVTIPRLSNSTQFGDCVRTGGAAPAKSSECPNDGPRSRRDETEGKEPKERQPTDELGTRLGLRVEGPNKRDRREKQKDSRAEVKRVRILERERALGGLDFTPKLRTCLAATLSLFYTSDWL
ncbi:hypothetical protein PoB_000645300 [Plakobranchus ocellatus]|uniref:Uncharacterized protein n=1 Tax=Plakobranchus ocellatus TaxID=259542 RepID=A0AAV3YBZ3_9GAST|nr:hypothetical protein PoB_000645300 [Plakobranchus ocellatus]